MPYVSVRSTLTVRSTTDAMAVTAVMVVHSSSSRNSVAAATVVDSGAVIAVEGKQKREQAERCEIKKLSRLGQLAAP